MLRGNHAAKIDDKGRLKIPNAFRALVEKQHGTELFVTSLTGEYVRLYPMPVWLALEEKLARMPSTHPARLKFLDRVNYYGQTAQIDVQGRVVIHAAAARVGGDDRRRRRLRADRHARRLEPRAVRGPDAARPLHRRRRPRPRRVRDLSHGRRSTHRCSCPKRSRCSSRRAAACSSTARSASAATAGRCSRPGRRACSASIAMPTRSAWRRPTLAPFGDRVELVHADYRDLDRVLDGARHRAHRRRARGPRRVVDAVRRRRAAGSAFSATSRSTCGWTARGRRRPPICWPTSDEEELANVIFQYGEERYSRRIARAIVQARRGLAGRDDRPARAHRPARDPACAVTSASIRPRARSRRCGSGSTASSRASTRSSARRSRRLRRRRPAGGDRVPFARGPHRQAHVPRAGARRDGAPDPDASGRSRPATTKWHATRGRAAPSCARLRGSHERDRLRVRDQERRAQQPDRPRGRRGAPAAAVRAVAIGGLLVAVLLFSAWQHFELVQHGYLMERLQQERAAEEEINRHLQLEIATLRAPRRIEDMATRAAAHGAAGARPMSSSSSGWRLRRRPPSPSSRRGSRFGT